MAAYESDSSLEGQSEYRETTVLLGYATKEPTDDKISHLGGFPAWMNTVSSPPARLAKCKVCNGLMSLLLQLNGDLPSHFPDDERRLHIFCCRRKACTRKPGTVRAIREVKRFPTDKKARAKEDGTKNASRPGNQAPPPDLGAALFGTTTSSPLSSNVNPFSISNSSPPSTNPFAPLPPASSLAAMPPQPPINAPEPPVETLAFKLRISNSKRTELPPSETEPWPEQSAFPSPFPHLYLDAEYETLAPENPVVPEASTSNPTYIEDDSAASGSGKDSFESSLDKTFLKFSDGLAQNPEQVLRYEFKGMPLLYSGNDAVAARFGHVPGKTKQATGTPRCENCGARRVFELQLVPGAISALEEDSLGLEEGMEWGTIILAVCSNDCAEVGSVVYREEWIGVQWEERVALK